MEKSVILEVRNDKGEIVGFFRQANDTRKMELFKCQRVTFDEVDTLFDIRAIQMAVKGDDTAKSWGEMVVIDDVEFNP